MVNPMVTAIAKPLNLRTSWLGVLGFDDPYDRQNDLIAYFNRCVLPREDQATSGHYHFGQDSFFMGARKLLLVSCPGRMINNIIHLIPNQERYILDILAYAIPIQSDYL